MSSAALQPNTFRPDIDGLRAVAVLLVVAFHARVPGFEIGFVGVDLFLVISGFLITHKLRSEIERTGRLDVVAFLLGRVRRLLPAAFVVVTITLLASLIVFVPFVWPELITDAWASAFYWANLRFGTQSADYFARGLAASPFQHMWSLAVEEQFYVVWPLVMAGTAQRSRRFALMVVAAITVGCFAHAVIDAREPTALTYYHPLSRGWELGAGATLALAWPWVAPVVARERVALALRIVGFGLLASTLIWWTGGSHYPGIASAGPVFSALLLIGAHGDRSPLAAGLASQPFQHVGRWSYSWYLWHWPVMVIGARALTRWTDVDVGWHHGAVLGVVSLVPAVLSYRYVESPLRHSRALTRSPARTIGLAIATSLASLLVIGGAGWWARTTLSEPELLAFAEAREDWPDMPSACATSDPDELSALCTTGDREGEHTMVIGDSHAANWVAGIAPAVQSRGGRLTTAIGGSCLLIGDGNVGEPSWCPEMREGIPAAIESLQPDRVIFSQSAVYRQLRGTSAEVSTATVWTEAMVDFLSPLREAEIDVIVILPTPKHDRHPIDCRAVESDPATCELSRADAEASVRVFADAVRSARAIVGHGALVDPIDLLCDDVSCSFRNGDQVVWADSHHITTAHARTYEAFFAELLGADGVER